METRREGEIRKGFRSNGWMPLTCLIWTRFDQANEAEHKIGLQIGSSCWIDRRTSILLHPGNGTRNSTNLTMTTMTCLRFVSVQHATSTNKALRVPPLDVLGGTERFKVVFIWNDATALVTNPPPLTSLSLLAPARNKANYWCSACVRDP